METVMAAPDMIRGSVALLGILLARAFGLAEASPWSSSSRHFSGCNRVKV